MIDRLIDHLQTSMALYQSPSRPWIWREIDRGIVIDTRSSLICFERMVDCDELAGVLKQLVIEKRNFSLTYEEP